MALRTWASTLRIAAGAGVLAGAGQLGIAYGLGILHWQTGAVPDGLWHAQLTWVAFFVLAAVVAGTVAGSWSARRQQLDPTPGIRVAIAAAAALGSAVLVPLVIRPAGTSHLPHGGDPRLSVALVAIFGLLIGVGAAIAILSVPAVYGNVVTCVSWLWAAALISSGWTLASGAAWSRARLGLLPAGGAWIPISLLGAPLLIALGVAAVARLGGNDPRAVSVSGFAGPALVGVAYLIGGPGAEQTNPYRYALLAAVLGVAVSVAVAVVRRRRVSVAVPDDGGGTDETAGVPAPTAALWPDATPDGPVPGVVRRTPTPSWTPAEAPDEPDEPEESGGSWAATFDAPDRVDQPGSSPDRSTEKEAPKANDRTDSEAVDSGDLDAAEFAKSGGIAGMLRHPKRPARKDRAAGTGTAPETTWSPVPTDSPPPAGAWSPTASAASTATSASTAPSDSTASLDSATGPGGQEAGADRKRGSRFSWRRGGRSEQADGSKPRSQPEPADRTAQQPESSAVSPAGSSATPWPVVGDDPAEPTPDPTGPGAKPRRNRRSTAATDGSASSAPSTRQQASEPTSPAGAATRRDSETGKWRAGTTTRVPAVETTSETADAVPTTSDEDTSPAKATRWGRSTKAGARAAEPAAPSEEPEPVAPSEEPTKTSRWRRGPKTADKTTETANEPSPPDGAVLDRGRTNQRDDKGGTPDNGDDEQERTGRRTTRRRRREASTEAEANEYVDWVKGLGGGTVRVGGADAKPAKPADPTGKK